MAAPHFHDHRLSHTFFLPFSLHFTLLASPPSLHAVHWVRSPLRSPLARPHAARTRTCASLTRSLFPSLPPEKERERERQFSSIAHPHVAGTRSGHAHSRNRTPYTVDPLAIFCYADCREGEHRNGCRGWTHEIVFPRDPDENTEQVRGIFEQASRGLAASWGFAAVLAVVEMVTRALNVKNVRESDNSGRNCMSNRKFLPANVWREFRICILKCEYLRWLTILRFGSWKLITRIFELVWWK